jgi:membrane-bound lytic murein transglycosylase D
MQRIKIKGKYSTIKWYALGTLTFVSVILLFLASDCATSDSVNYSEIKPAGPPALPDTLQFSGEPVPLEYFDVKEGLEREILVNSYWHSQTIWLIQKANRYFPVIEPILKENNIPDDFKYLAIAESGLSQTVSPMGAVGFWQILESTAKDYGLEVNDEIDERYNIEKATLFACKYLKESYDKYQSWTLAAASYNAGRKGVDRQIDRQQEFNYYNLLFSEETARYVYRILALKVVFENPQNYNFYIPEEKLYQPIPYKDVEVNAAVASWADFAKEHETNYKILKMLNPWLRDDKLTNSGKKTYTIKVPKKRARIIE